jgi:hypothetical protein
LYLLWNDPKLYKLSNSFVTAKQIHVALGLRQGSIPEGTVAKKMGAK